MLNGCAIGNYKNCSASFSIFILKMKLCEIYYILEAYLSVHGNN